MKQLPDLLLKGATLWIDNPLKIIVGAMHIRDGKIVRIIEGPEMPADCGEILELDGKHIIPGLIDAHRHFFITAVLATHGDASQWRSRADALEGIEFACRRARSRDEWIFFSRMDHTGWKKPVLPTIKEIDAVAGDMPVFVTDITLHRALLSTTAAKKSGLRKETLRFAGDIDSSRSGKPGGVIWEDAVGQVLFAMCRDMYLHPEANQTKNILLDEAARCLQMGLTRVHDPGLPPDMQRVLRNILPDTPLKISWSISANESLYMPPERAEESESVHSPHAPKSVKFFLDGAHRTAASMPIIAGLKAMIRAALESTVKMNSAPLRLLLEQKITLQGGRLTLPYLRYPHVEDLINKVSVFSDRGYRIVLHAVGNDAVMQAADVLGKLEPRCGASVEHLLVMNDRNLDTFARCGAVASVQPGFIPIHAPSLELQGAIPYLKTFALRSMLKRGIPICISSDGPCGPDDPLYNIRKAVDRKKIDGGMLDPGERIRPKEALAAATAGGSLSLGLRHEGLAAGAPATFCIASGDPFQEESRIEQTWIDGVRAF